MVSSNFSSLLRQRRSVRAYLPTPVADTLLHEVLAQARLAPSGANLQPGAFVQVRGAVREAFAAGEIEVRAAFIEVTAGETVQHRGSAV